MIVTRIKTFLQTLAVVLAAGFCALQPAQATDVDLATMPMVSGLTKSVPPNIYFILDDSTSMSWDYMPDDVDNNNTKRCFQNWGYNKIYYNPNLTYSPPLNSDGTSKAASTFTAAKIDGFGVTSTSTTDLSASNAGTQRTLGSNPLTMTSGSKVVTVTSNGHGLVTGQSVSLSGASSTRGTTVSGTYVVTVVNANSYTITTTGSAATSSGTGGGSSVRETPRTPTASWYDYTSSPTSPATTCASDSSYTLNWPGKAGNSGTTAQQQQNYANWYSYYRTRINMMKSASGRAFSTISDKYRVGFDVISNDSANSVTVNIAKFNATQKSSWYNALYAADPNPGSTHYTPLRGALSKAGRLYAGRVVTGTSDPVQYSCQQNFTILTTDGYWNLSDEVTSGSSRYGAYQEDNTTLVGNQDGGSTPRPYYDAGGYSNTLADIAMYYYKTDLRPTMGSLGGYLDGTTTRLDVSPNNVPSAGSDTATYQHMTLFGLGLGVAGTLAYDPNYLTGGSSDYNAILQGTKNWPNPNVTSTSLQVTERIDDLWHAAVNGRGRYLSASNPDAVVAALSSTLSAISVTNASAAAAATSSLEPVAGDNYAYVAQYTTGLWYGDVLARTMDLDTGALSATATWSARTQLQSKVSTTSDTRTIYTFDASGANKLKTFVSSNLTAEKTAGYFKSSGSNPNGKLTQYDTWTSTQQSAATDDAMIAFIRGQTSNQGQPADTSKLFRDRTYALGDVVDSAPVYVSRPPFNYSDTDYTTFATSNASRTPMVYVAANDGMLHAFNSSTGNETWAYIPSAVVPYLYKLADAGYANNHRFYVDGPITVGDAYDTSTSTWKTILIAGLGGGGRGYFALDVTNPASPKALWEFGAAQDADMGYAYGNPILTKRVSDGRWVVLVTSGYNNNVSGGDGKGRLYVLDAITGAKLSTGAATTGEIITSNSVNDPNLSGIGKINNYTATGLVDNTTQYVYGGDLSGALWRFDLATGTSTRLGRTSATATSANGGNQPITVRPELARIRDSAGNYYRVVYFGTGRYLGLSDLNTTAPSSAIAQAIYAVKDTGGDIGVFPTSGTLVAQTLDTSVSPRTIPSPVAVDWSTKNGWYVTLPAGERVNVDPRLQLGTLVMLSNTPDDNYCTIGGTSILYALNYSTGAAIKTDGAVGFPVGNSLSTGVTLIRLPSQKLVAIVTEADTTVQAMTVPVAPGAGTGVKRIGWRELN